MQANYNTIKFIDIKTVWEKNVYDFREMGDIDNELDCSFLCNNVEKENSCDLFAFEDQKCYFGSSGESKGVIENDLANATIYVTKGNVKLSDSIVVKTAKT